MIQPRSWPISSPKGESSGCSRERSRPGRGHWERAAAGASAAVVGTDEVPPSYAESVRIVFNVGSLRRIFYALPFLAAGFIGLITLTSLFYQNAFHLDDWQRGIVTALAEPAQIVGILLGIPLATRLMLRDPGLCLRMLAVLGVVIGIAWTVFAFAPPPLAAGRTSPLLPLSPPP